MNDTLAANTSLDKASGVPSKAEGIAWCSAIYWPFKHRTLSKGTYRIAIVMVWTLAILINATYITLDFLNLHKYIFYVGMAFTFISTIIICGCNIGILRKFQHGSIASQHENRASQNRRLTRTLLLVSVLALLTWLPLIIFNGFRALDVAVSWRYRNITSILNYSSSFINPIVYILRTPEFRQPLALCCFERQAAINMEDIAKRNNAATAVLPATELITIRTDSSHVQLACQQEIMDTKL